MVNAETLTDSLDTLRDLHAIDSATVKEKTFFFLASCALQPLATRLIQFKAATHRVADCTATSRIVENATRNGATTRSADLDFADRRDHALGRHSGPLAVGKSSRTRQYWRAGAAETLARAETVT